MDTWKHPQWPSGQYFQRKITTCDLARDLLCDFPYTNSPVAWPLTPKAKNAVNPGSFFMMILKHLKVNFRFHSRHQQVLLGYLENESTLSQKDWGILKEAVDILEVSWIWINSTKFTFRQFYNEMIDRVFANPFLKKLLSAANLAKEGRKYQAVVAREICKFLDGIQGFHRDLFECRLLLVYCLFWWASFAWGYRFEVEIFRDLAASGIQFLGHDILNSLDRRSPWDLLISIWRGDIKYSTSFLLESNLARWISDFFITRWHIPEQRQILVVVLLREAIWKELKLIHTDLQRVSATVSEVSRILPKPVAFKIDKDILTALGYQQWKEIMVRVQAKKAP